MCLLLLYAIQKLLKNWPKADDTSDILKMRVPNVLVSLSHLSCDYSCDRCLHHKLSNHQ